MAETRVLIYGSCVSRDTFEFLPDGHTLLAYVARQSAISVGSPAAGVKAQLTELPSAFQNRMVAGDVKGDLLDVLGRVAPQVDVLLVDLIDERGGVIAIGGGHVTKLAEMWAAGGRTATRGGRHIPFGTDEHFALWVPAVDAVVTRIAELGLLPRTVVLRTPWASLLDDGGQVPVPGWMTPPDEANLQYARYFDHLTELGLSVVELPEDLARSTTEHQWGPSPFHYTAQAYEHLASGITETVAAGAEPISSTSENTPGTPA
ncbi:DUF6270 domain-containing protein [Phycicoccus sp. Root101]|uniref:DUF6270 domain-containing protein n=1 Tax=Phycicoccus sp. Root101 TaxID=1736421 RepID=UPI000702F712|nr:DUF6270 domain-containing protein [Phycicoccus sp. Root101]KQU68203.1 hypothetical protein ASC58_11595 [Phycicoccus sp. Root101]